MKTQSILILFSIILIGFTACQKDSNAIQSEYITTEEDQKIINYIVKEFGFPESEIEVSESHVIVEGDIAYPKVTFWSDYVKTNSAARSHYKQPYLVNTNNSFIVIPIYSFSLPYLWEVALFQAITEWNNLNGNIIFSITNNSSGPTSTGINIVNQFINVSATIAYAEPTRSNGLPGNNIIINTGYTGTLTSSQRKMAMAHELGHTIGFNHTDSGDGTRINNVSYWCRYLSDNASVMRRYYNSWNGFSSCDIQAYNELY